MGWGGPMLRRRWPLAKASCDERRFGGREARRDGTRGWRRHCRRIAPLMRNAGNEWSSPRRRAAAWAAALGLAVAGAAWIAQAELQARREAFETDARIAHRVLSQRVVQHDAILATLALLDAPGAGAAAAPAELKRLAALYPQLLQVVRHDALAPWPAAEASALAAAEATSRREGRAALAAFEPVPGRYWLVRATGKGEAAAYALQIELRALRVAGEWPLPSDSPVQAVLALGGQRFEIQAGAPHAGPWRFGFAKGLASPSQPFDLQLAQDLGWSGLPWGTMAAWVALVLAALAAATAWQRQRAGARRAQQLLRLGQVGRLNALGELAAGIAHELNQPLTAVMANTAAAARLLAEDEPDPAAARSAMDQATQQARRAAEVLSRLRRLIERPDAARASGPQAVQPLLAAALDLLETELRRAQVKVHLQCEPPTLAVQADAVALEQIVHNLLGNALQALQQVDAGERQLWVQAQAKPGEPRIVVIRVRDSGPGIAPEALPHLFEPFFSTRAGGLGLGLSLCETLAGAMGGTLQAAHAAPRGALFTLTLPQAGRD